MMASASAQFKGSGTTVAPARAQMQFIKPQAKMEVAQMHTPGTPVVKAPKKEYGSAVWYHRPAGAYPASIVVEDSAYAGMLKSPYLAIKPYADYTFIGEADVVSENATFEWDVQYWSEDNDTERQWATVPGKTLTWHWGYETDEVPVLFLVDVLDLYYWQYGVHRKVDNTSGNPIVTDECDPATILSVRNTIDIWGYDILKSSKTFTLGGLKGDQRYPMAYYSGPDPYGENEEGWWFGKNGGTTDTSTGRTCRIDGIAQAFEKPTAPYLLNQVVVDCAVLNVAGPVDMTCKIYKLDEIPPYQDDDVATLPDEPGELIAKGRAHVTPETWNATNGLIFFTLYGEEDGLEYEVTPTIDCAILVVIDGYNEPEMADLRDFSALICSDIHVDEGFGELAYLKWGVPDEEGNLDHYKWVGLNNFFSSGEMKTGFSIFLSTENPWLAFNNDTEEGKYFFPEEGGVMDIDFMSCEPSADDGWWMSWNGDEDLPEWLTIELTDGVEDGEFNGFVNAVVTAEPLPAGVRYREAVVRFEYPGAYLDYKFIQGSFLPPPRPPENFDLNDDGRVNLSDLNQLIDGILRGYYDANIADINRMVDYILKN